MPSDPNSLRLCRSCGEEALVKDFRRSRKCKDGVSYECKACLVDRRWHEMKLRVMRSKEPWLQLQSEQVGRGSRRALSFGKSEQLHREAVRHGYTNSWDLCWRAPHLISEMFDAVHKGQRYLRRAG